MTRALGVRQHVGIPVTTAWGPREVDLSIDLMEPELGAVELAGFPTPGGDVDGPVVFQGVLYLIVHEQSPTDISSARRCAGPYPRVMGCCLEIIKIPKGCATEELAKEKRGMGRL